MILVSSQKVLGFRDEITMENAGDKTDFHRPGGGFCRKSKISCTGNCKLQKILLKVIFPDLLEENQKNRAGDSGLLPPDPDAGDVTAVTVVNRNHNGI